MFKTVMLVKEEEEQNPIEDKVLLHHTKEEKQWNGKFDPKWDGSFHIEKILGNGAYKLRWDNKILAKAAYGN
ncbi:hypothetical protein G9A89_013725 [Geosiphon pyriformis]|nr:hypothetical protein G9A89_013725 [Geosiphon pyriformis]